MPLKRSIFPNANNTPTLEDLAWLEWRPDTDRLLLSAAAIRMLQIDASLIPETQFSLMQLFEKNSRNKLAITFEDIVNSGKPQAIELLRSTPQGLQLILLHGQVSAPAGEPVLLARLEDISASSEGIRRVSARTHFNIFVNLIQRDADYFESVPLGLVLVNAGFITKANFKASELLGTSITDLIGEPVSRLLSSKQAYDCYMEAMWGEITEEETSIVEVDFEDDQGSPIWLRIRMVRAALPEAENACLCMIEDISDRKKLEQDMWDGLAQTLSAKEVADNASRAKSEFLAMVSHEIRTPLSAVIGMQRLALRDSGLSEKTRQNLDMAQTNAEFLLDLLNDILDFSKIEAGKLILEEVDFSLRYLIADSVGILKERAEMKNIALDVTIDDNVHDVLLGDPARLKQVLINLIGNGIKFTDRGSVSLNVSTEALDEGSTRIRFDVKDTGIGIPPKAQVRLFQKFAQADTSTTRRFGGTGLGLAICKQLVDLMQGDIGLTSKVNEGSCFSFVIPFRAGSTTSNALMTRLKPHSHQLQILCAEDFLPNQIIIQGLLEEMGHRVDFVDNGRRALEALAQRNYDLVIMDGRMPEMDGATAMRLIRAEGEGQFYIPNPKIRIIMLTANADDESRRFYLSCGADDFLVKPIDESLLHQSIARAIEARLADNAPLLPLFHQGGGELEALFGATVPVADESGRQEESPHARDEDISSSNLHVRLRAAFREGLETRILELEAAYKAQDFATMANIFHGLKGSAGYIWPGGALQQSSDILEKAADQQDWAVITARMPDFRRLLDDVMKGASV
jgi:PAS domain S-box-containing protein